MSDVREELPFVLRSAGKTDVGRRRRHNEDAVLLRPNLDLYLLADGAGGHQAGEIASAVAMTSVANFFEATQRAALSKPDVDEFGLWTGERRLGAAVKKANLDILDIGKSSDQHKGMGTTIVAASLSARSGILHVAHVGDSRCYRLRNAQFEPLTQDHSLIVDVLELRPEIDDETLAHLPTNVITRALGMEANLRVSIRSHQIVEDDRYLLCSDGLWSMLTHDQMAETLGADRSPEQIVVSLIALANREGGDDNIAAVVIQCEPGSDRSGVKEHRASVATRAAKPVAAPREESFPEIMIIGIEEVDLEPNIRVLPERSMSAGEQDAVAQFVAPMRKPGPAAGRVAPGVCARCGQMVEGDFCPFCGTPRGKDA